MREIRTLVHHVVRDAQPAVLLFDHDVLDLQVVGEVQVASDLNASQLRARDKLAGARVLGRDVGPIPLAEETHLEYLLIPITAHLAAELFDRLHVGAPVTWRHTGMH